MARGRSRARPWYRPLRTESDAFGLIGDRYHNSDYARTGLNRNINKGSRNLLDFTTKPKR